MGMYAVTSLDGLYLSKTTEAMAAVLLGLSTLFFSFLLGDGRRTAQGALLGRHPGLT